MTFVLSIVVESLKKIIAKLPLPKSFFERPSEACDCDLIISNGHQGGKPGLPSGHMATLFLILTVLISMKVIEKKYYPFLFIYVFLMAWSRYEKRCHTIPQIVLGSFIGWVFGVLFLAITNRI